MTEDYYATLGVAPKAEATDIRAAYLALMRQYHPDKNDSPAAVEHAQAIIAAFAVLGDVEKRLSYDWARRRAAEAAALPPPWWLRVPRSAIAAALALLLLIPLALVRFPAPQQAPPAAPTAPTATAQTNPRQRPAIARPPAPAPIATPSPVAVLAPIVPEPPALPQADPVRLARAQVPRAEPPPAAPPSPLALRTASRTVPPRERPEPRRDAAVIKPPIAKAECRSVKPGAEAAICNNANLAALDRNAVAFYNQSLQFGAVTKRGVLLDSRNSFLARREACRSDDCLRNVHLSYMREVATIVEQRPETPR